jgi:signal transduction histidine kinase
LSGAAELIRRRRIRYADLPLFWKLLVPYVILLVIVALVGTLLIVRDLDARAQTTLDQQLSEQVLAARSQLHDTELYLIESATFAANLQGLSGAAARRDKATTTRLAQSVLALKSRLNLLVVTDRRGNGLTEFARDRTIASAAGSSWSSYPGVTALLHSRSGNESAAVFGLPGRPVFVVAAPICTTANGCRPSGVALAGIRADAVASALRLEPGTGFSMYDAEAHLIGSHGASLPAPPVTQVADRLPRVTTKVKGEKAQVVYAPLILQNQRVGTFAVALPVGRAFASARHAAHSFAWLLLAFIAGIVLIGLLVNQLLLRQVRPLVAANRRLGAGDLTARVPVRSSDELGELAIGVNKMAEQLEASVESLRSGVEQRTDEVRRLLQERTEFFATLSHEFRTPLAIIRAQADLLGDPQLRKDAAAASVSLSIVSEAATQALDIVNDILEASRSDSEVVDLVLDEVDLGALLAAMQPTIQGLASSAELRADMQIGPLPRVYADARRLRQVVLNLVDNAVKYTPSGGVVTVIAAAASDQMAEIVVHDTGVGIPPDAMDQLFDAFYRVPNVKPQHGESSSGIGLTLAKRLVEAHGGTLTVSSVPGEGSTFTVTLPASVPQSGRRRKRASAAAG